MIVNIKAYNMNKTEEINPAMPFDLSIDAVYNVIKIKVNTAANA